MKAHPKDRCTAKAALSHKWLATIAIPASEGPDSEAYSPGETSDLSPIPESKSFTVELMTQEFASWDTEELSQKTIQPRKSDPHITAFLNYEQSTSSSTDLSPHKGDNATMTPSSYSPTASKVAMLLMSLRALRTRPLLTPTTGPSRGSLLPRITTQHDHQTSLRSTISSPTVNSIIHPEVPTSRTAEILHRHHR